MLAASGWPKMPKTPHSSLNLSNMFVQATRLREVPLDRRRPHALGLVHRHVDHDRAADRDPQPVAAGLADDARRHARRRRALAAPSSRRSGATDTTTRDADSPNSAAATFDAASRDDRRRRRSTPRRRCRRCRSSTRRASPPGRRPNSRAPTASSRSSASVDEQRLQRALGVEIQRRRHAAHQVVHDLQVLAAAELAAALAEQHDRRRPTAWNRAADDAIGVLEQPDDADDRRRIDRACRRSRCTG